MKNAAADDDEENNAQDEDTVAAGEAERNIDHVKGAAAGAEQQQKR